MSSKMFWAFLYLFLGYLATSITSISPHTNTTSLIRNGVHFRPKSQFNVIYRARNTTHRTPTIHPAENFNATNDAQVLKNAMEGLGTNEAAIINVLTQRSNSQRVEIAEQYMSMFGRVGHKESMTLRTALISDLSGKFLDTMLALILPTPMFYAAELNKAISRWGTDEDVLIEIICSLNSSQLKAVSKAYGEKYVPLVEDVEMDTSGDFRDFLVALLVRPRDETNVTDLQQAKIDAQALYDAGVDQWGTDEEVFYNIFATRNFNQLRLIFDEYKDLAYHRIDQAIKEEFSGDATKALLTFVSVVRNLPAYFATRLYDTMINLGTRDHTLIRIIVTRCELDLGDLMEEYYTIYEQDLEAHVYDDTSGDYRKSLLRLLGH